MLAHGDEAAALPLTAAAPRPPAAREAPPRLALDAPSTPFDGGAGVELEFQGVRDAARFWEVVNALRVGAHAGCR